MIRRRHRDHRRASHHVGLQRSREVLCLVRGRSLAAIGAIAVLAIALLSSCGSSKATIAEVHVLEGGRALDVIVNTCHADLDIDIHETAESITITASRSDREFLGGDDCQDAVRVALEDAVGSRTILTSGDREVPIVSAAETSSSSEVPTPALKCDDPPPQLELSAASSVIPMDLVYLERFCGYHSDGAAMLDSSYRPPTFPVRQGKLTIYGLPASAEVLIDFRPLTDAISIAAIRPTTAVEPDGEGVYSVSVDEAGCSYISVLWRTRDGRGQHVALIAPPGVNCPTAST
jgi:hypothetical protein